MQQRRLARRLAVPVLVAASFFAGSATGRAAGHPHLRTALTELSRAAYQLTLADRDPDGRRDRALADTNAAMSELRAVVAAGAE